MPNVFKANGKDNPVDNYMFKVNNSNIETGCEIYPKLTVNGVVLVSLMSTLNIFHTFF